MVKLDEKQFKDFLEAFSKGLEKEDKESPIFEHLKNNIKYLESAEDFNTMAIYPIMKVVKTLVRTQFNSDNHLAESIYTQYSFYERNISNLCSRFYGTACSVDRARFLLKSAIKWKETNKIPKFNWKQEYTYYYPPKGTMEQWLNLIEGLYNLYYGDVSKYLLAFQKLVEVHKQ